MSTRAEFARAVDAFNNGRWDSAAEQFEDLGARAEHATETTLCEGLSKLARVYEQLLEGEVVGEDPYIIGAYEVERVADEFEEVLPHRLLGLTIPSLVERLHQLHDDLRLIQTPEPFQLLVSSDEPRPGEDAGS